MPNPSDPTPPPTEPDASSSDFRSGFVALLGEPNVGKSTLINALLDFKVAIVSPKAQTTRDRISGIFTNASCQIVFVDTPGLMEPRDLFNESLRDGALEALDGADAACHLVDAGRPAPLPEAARSALKRLQKPLLLVVNKTDVLKNSSELTGETDLGKKREACAALLKFPIDLDLYSGLFFISARKREGLEALIEATRALLPRGPMLYDPELPTDRSLRFLASEIVREKVLENIEQEVPYAVAVRTEEFVEREPKYLVRVVIYVEHESQKGILIGGGGSRLRKIGARARPEIERLADHPIFLELWVKVRKNWRKRPSDLREFGYRSGERKKRRKRRRK